jgi:alpha-N-arabinofuranosidase
MNRHPADPAALDLDLRAFGDLTVAEHLYLGGDDLDAVNSIETPDRIAPRRAPGVATGQSTAGRRLTASLPPVSWNMIRLVPTAS